MGKDLLQGFVRCVNISKDYVNIRIMGIEAKFALEWFWFWAYMEWRKTWRLLKNGATEVGFADIENFTTKPGLNYGVVFFITYPKEIIRDILAGVEAGENMYTTMEYYSEVFPYLYINMILA